MVKLIEEHDGKYNIYGTYATDQLARAAIVDYCNKIGFKSYYWNCYMVGEGEYSGGTHVDYGSWSHFFIIIDENGEKVC